MLPTPQEEFRRKFRYILMEIASSGYLLKSWESYLPREATVKETAGRPIHRPVVEVFCEANGSVVKAPYLLDLQQLANIVIVGKADK
jgi:hypothetical protein